MAMKRNSLGLRALRLVRSVIEPQSSSIQSGVCRALMLAGPDPLSVDLAEQAERAGDETKTQT
jgi:hypothetical protein